jgi:hypothetical protein
MKIILSRKTIGRERPQDMQVMQVNATTTGTNCASRDTAAMTSGQMILKDVTRCPHVSTNKHIGYPPIGNST